MSARNPTSWNEWTSEEDLYPGQPIVTTEPSNVADDQTQILDAPQMIISDVFERIPTSAAAYTLMDRRDVVLKNMCNDTGVTTISTNWALLLYADAGVTTIGMRITDGTTTSTSTISTSITSKIWRGYITNTWPTNGNTVNFQILLSVVAGTGSIYYCGLAAYCSQT